MNSIISIAQEADLHRETYIAILNSLLKDAGAKTKLAQMVGITREYLSYLLAHERDPYNLSDISVTRTPSYKVAKKIVDALGVSREEKESLLDHMILSNEKKLLFNQEIRNAVLDKTLQADMISNIGKMFHDAAKQPVIAKSLYINALNNASTMLKYISPKDSPLEFARICHLIYLIQVTRGRFGDSLWHAKLGRVALENLFLNEYKEKHELENTLTQMIISEGHTYHLLCQDQIAIKFYEKVQHTKPFKQNPNHWNILLIDNKINSISSLPRFSISEVENLADSGLTICGIDESKNIYRMFSISLHRIRAHMHHNNIKKAGKLLEVALSSIDNITPIIGIGNSIRLFLTAAQFYSHQNAIDEWQYFIDMAYGATLHEGYELQKTKIVAEMYRMEKTKFRP